MKAILHNLIDKAEKVCEIAQKSCVFAHFLYPSKIIFYLIINKLIVWHDFCCIVSIEFDILMYL